MPFVCRPMLISILVAALCACSSEPPPGDFREPRCEPRVHTAPGRLNLDTDAGNHGITAPCNATVQFYIARNTDLHSVAAEFRFLDADGNPVASDASGVVLDAVGGGMLRTDYPVSPVAGHACHDLDLELALNQCRDASGAAIACPDVRVKTSMVLRDFRVVGDELDLCYDD